jgi:transposase
MNVNIGIDVSKEQLDVAVRPTGERFTVSNDDEGCAELRKRIAKLKGTPERIVLEPTGGYEMRVVQMLAFAKLPVVVVNARQIRQFAQATGRLAKTDKIDAEVLAHFAEALQPKIKAIPDAAHRELEALVVRRRQLVDMRAAEQKRKQTAPAMIHVSIDAVVEVLTKQIDDVDTDLDKTIRATPAWKAADERNQSTPGVGRVLSVSMTALVPELGILNRKAIAALVGVAPMNRDSGKTEGKRTTWGGRAPVRAVLYMATLAAIRFNPAVRALHDRLIAKGKAPMVAIVACMRKLLTILNAMARDGIAWNPQLAAAKG